MQILSKFGLIAGAILVSTLGFATLGQALPSNGLPAQLASVSVSASTEKAHYSHYHHYHHQSHHYHHGYHHHH